uniref:non-specific serine/threonine protein kinase n=2 Tax=Steinernema glaseri TaxID=37863 RepID=A0A1I7Y050_9BILA
MSSYKDLYIDEEFIGSGNFSSVYRALNQVNGQVVALKKVDLGQINEPKALEDCLKETKILLLLNHENIVRCYSSFLEKGMLVVVLELADQGDLMSVISEHKTRRQLMREEEIWNYFVQIMRGIDYMHSRRVMHRDIKPANVFLTATGTVKLGDLGLSRVFSAKTNAALSIVGTPYYMSPERIDESAYDFKSDIWSLGCMLYEMAALQSPFYADKKNYSDIWSLGCMLYEMAALQSPFYADKKNYVSLCSKIKFCEYPPIPADVYSKQVREQ